MSIRLTLQSILVALGVTVIGLTSVGLWSSWKNKSDYVFSEKSSHAIEHLLTAAGHWAVERGVTNSVLNSAGNINPSLLKTINERRSKGDAAYENALNELNKFQFSGKDEKVQSLNRIRQNVLEMREQADKNFNTSKVNRDVNVMKSWVPTMSKLIIASQDLRFMITRLTANKNPELGRQAELKHFSWLMSEYAGRERAIVGGIIASGTAFSEKKLQILSSYRGRVLNGWDLVQKLSEQSNKEVKETIEQTKKVLFGDFDKLRQDIYNASINGDDYPVDAKTWIEASTKAINTVLATQVSSTNETNQFVEELISEANSSLLINVLVMIAAIGMVIFGFFTVSQKVLKPLSFIRSSMEVLANGETTVTVPYNGLNNEIGEMARSVQVFKENKIKADEIKEQQRQENQVKIERANKVESLIASFESTALSAIQTVASAATELSSTSENLMDIIRNSNDQIAEANSEAKVAMESVNTVAVAAEELTSTVKEISLQINKSNDLVTNSVGAVKDADHHAGALSDASHKVQEVTSLISEISGQTNLLALNATIEAARAGEMGKGFAVVANEVKNLAGQTDKSIQEIESVINDINIASSDIISSLSMIDKSVMNISESSSGIASAVEEQSATTQNISHSMSAAAKGAKTISGNLEKISQSSSLTQSATEEVVLATTELSKQAELLEKELNLFLSGIRAA